MQENKPITLSRDCDAVLIPVGTPISLPEGSAVLITQDLGGSYTVNVNGNLARIEAKNADALGFELEEKADPAIEKEVTGDGSVDEDVIWDQLRTCYDPEIPINIVELGLIYECNITPLGADGNQVDIVMTLTAAGCGMGDFLAEDVRTKVLTVANVTGVNVSVTFDPPWDQEMMSEAARLETGMY
ncbi:MAG: putative Fe-S cluster assembly protein SufT [Proteobacteria bacterium]|nr:putative Fe-S cluster assembly protein SufT [Pseudomonadota bacterium]